MSTDNKHLNSELNLVNSQNDIVKNDKDLIDDRLLYNQSRPISYIPDDDVVRGHRLRFSVEEEDDIEKEVKRNIL
jgi:hypothetical protein